MDHWTTISADFPTNGRKVKTLSHRGCFLRHLAAYHMREPFTRAPVEPQDFDTDGVKIFSREGWLWALWNSEYVKVTSNPVGGNFWPTGPQVESKIRAHWAQSENIFR